MNDAGLSGSPDVMERAAAPVTFEISRAVAISKALDEALREYWHMRSRSDSKPYRKCCADEMKILFHIRKAGRPLSFLPVPIASRPASGPFSLSEIEAMRAVLTSEEIDELIRLEMSHPWRRVAMEVAS